MAKTEGEKLTEEKLAKGGVLAKLYFDMQSKNREELQPLLADLINQRLMKERGVVYVYGAVDEPIEKEGVYSTTAIVTVLFDSFFPLVSISFNYAPAAIEILKPLNEMRFKTAELQGMLMDLVGISMTYSKYILENVLKGEDLSKMRAALDNRKEIGKKFIEEKKDIGKDGKR